MVLNFKFNYFKKEKILVLGFIQTLPDETVKEIALFNFKEGCSGEEKDILYLPVPRCISGTKWFGINLLWLDGDDQQLYIAYAMALNIGRVLW